MASRKELFYFRYGLQEFFFTSASKVVRYGNIDYLPAVISRGNIEDADINKNEIDIVFTHYDALRNAVDQSFTQIFLNKIYLESVRVQITELYNNEALVLFKGRVALPQFDDNSNEMTLTCTTAESYMNREILTRKYQKPCPNSLYDKFCGVSSAEFSFKAKITSINNLDIGFSVVPTQVIDENGDPVFDENNEPVMETKTYPVGWLNRGVLQKNGIFTFINTNTENTAKLYRNHIGLAVNDIVDLMAGCDQSIETCDQKFKNHKRYGGHAYMPSENPLETQLIK